MIKNGDVITKQNYKYLQVGDIVQFSKDTPLNVEDSSRGDGDFVDSYHGHLFRLSNCFNDDGSDYLNVDYIGKPYSEGFYCNRFIWISRGK